MRTITQMRKLIFIITILITLIACKSVPLSTVQDRIKTQTSNIRDEADQASSLAPIVTPHTDNIKESSLIIDKIANTDIKEQQKQIDKLNEDLNKANQTIKNQTTKMLIWCSALGLIAIGIGAALAFWGNVKVGIGVIIAGASVAVSSVVFATLLKYIIIVSTILFFLILAAVFYAIYEKRKAIFQIVEDVELLKDKNPAIEVGYNQDKTTTKIVKETKAQL